jgi:hypothetical protein
MFFAPLEEFAEDAPDHSDAEIDMQKGGSCDPPRYV